MEQVRQEKMKISKELLDSMLVGVKTQEDLWGKDGIITQLNKALLERILDAEMDFHLENDQDGRAAGNSRNGHGRKTVHGKFGQNPTTHSPKIALRSVKTAHRGIPEHRNTLLTIHRELPDFYSL